MHEKEIDAIAKRGVKEIKETHIKPMLKAAEKNKSANQYHNQDVFKSKSYEGLTASTNAGASKLAMSKFGSMKNSNPAF